ncbi:hypothetical protein SE17_18655, partial [Kouleothrix aurantiaca]
MRTNTPAPTANPARHAARIGPTLDHVWLAAALLLIALRPLLTPIPPNDFWWHMATGRIIASTGAIPSVDSFSFTQAGQPFFNQGWLAQLLMYWLHQVGGVPLLLVVQSLVITLAYGLLLRLCIRRSGRLRLSVGLLLLVTLPLSFTNWIVRPQSYALPIFAAFLTIVTEYRLGMSRRLWLLPPLMALWVNIHGTFVLGLALIGLTFAGMLFERGENREGNGEAAGSRFAALRSLALWGALTAAAMLLNPRGLGVLTYVRNLLGSNSVTTLVTEWAPPTIRDLEGVIFFLFVMLCGAVLAYARRRPPLADMLLFGAFLWLALGASRNVVWFGMVATPLLIVQAASLGRERPPTRAFAGSPALHAALIGVLALLVLLALPWVKPALDLPPAVGALVSEDTPVAAVDFLRAQPDRPRRLFHTEAYGSYLIWAAPEQPVFVDTRIELYPFAQWRDYINLGQANNAAALLQKYDIDGLLLNAKQQAPLVA